MNYQIKQDENTKKFGLFKDDEFVGILQPKNYPRDKSGLIYKIPDNELGRQWIMGSKIHDGLILTPHLDKNINNSTPRSQSQPQEDVAKKFLTPEEFDTYTRLLNKIKKNQEIERLRMEQQRLIDEIKRLEEEV